MGTVEIILSIQQHEALSFLVALVIAVVSAEPEADAYGYYGRGYGYGGYGYGGYRGKRSAEPYYGYGYGRGYGYGGYGYGGYRGKRSADAEATAVAEPEAEAEAAPEAWYGY